jgi:glycosyltransferase involved in cell wall biosynthesis
LSDPKDAPRRLRVVHIVPELGVGGAERHVVTLMPALDHDRFEPAVVCIGEPGALFPLLAAAGVPAVARRHTKRGAPLALLDLVRDLRRFRPDIVLVRGYSAEVLGRLAARIVGVRANVVWIHNLGDLDPHSGVRRVLDRLLDRITSAYFAVASAQLEYITGELRLPAHKVRIIHNGVDTTDFDPQSDRRAVAALGIADCEPVVAVIGAMRPEKDHKTFLDAARVINRMMPSARFLLVGDGPLRGQLEARAVSLGLHDRMVFAGVRDDIADLLRGADVFVLSSYSDCFPMALLEAMASGRPAVCTAVGGVLEIVDDGVTGFVVPPRDARALADKVLAVLNDSDLASAMGAAGRRRVEEEFSLKQSVARTERALEEVAAAAGVTTEE